MTAERGPELLVSANYTFESEDRARELGVTGGLVSPRSGRGHRMLDLANMIRVPGEDRRVRQRELDRVLEIIVQAARDQSITLPTAGAYLSLRISFSDDGEQLGFALASEFLGAWSTLGGDLMIDN